MTYTPEFEKWVAGVTDLCSPGIAQQLLSAFAGLVWEEAAKVRGGKCGCHHCVGEAFYDLCAKFGLEGKP